MKKFTTIIAAMAITVATFAQAPQKISYQAVVRNSSNELVSNQQVGMQISILEGMEDGKSVYTETQTPTSNANGLVSVEIGSGTVVSGDFTTIDWANGTYFIKTETDVEGGTNYTITGTSQLLSVPYALHAKTADNVFSGDYNDLLNAPEIPVVDDLATKEALADSIAQVRSEIPGIENLATQQALEDSVVKLRSEIPAEIMSLYIETLMERIEILELSAGVILKDIEGNIYPAITIGKQTWMAENLKTTTYNNGDAIPLVEDATEWSALTTGARCWYKNDSLTYAETYGSLYNWETVNSGNLCPTGWHVPSEAEWDTLVVYVGGEDIAAAKLKEAGTEHWSETNEEVTNEYGFTALPGGFRSVAGTYYSINLGGSYWTTTEDESEAANAKLRALDDDSNAIRNLSRAKGIAYSVRCLKD